LTFLKLNALKGSEHHPRRPAKENKLWQDKQNHSKLSWITSDEYESEERSQNSADYGSATNPARKNHLTPLPRALRVNNPPILPNSKCDLS
jgi:hypothetical protein